MRVTWAFTVRWVIESLAAIAGLVAPVMGTFVAGHGGQDGGQQLQPSNPAFGMLPEDSYVVSREGKVVALVEEQGV
jgi:hypothetical protein